MFKVLGDMEKLAAMARKKKDKRMALMRNRMGHCVKAVHVFLETTCVAEQTVCCIDLDYADVPNSALMRPESAIADPLRKIL
jgi:hypothetical protein